MKCTEDVPEDHDLWLKDGRKPQGDDWIIGVVGGDPARSNPILDWRNVEAMVRDYLRQALW